MTSRPKSVKVDANPLFLNAYFPPDGYAASYSLMTQGIDLDKVVGSNPGVSTSFGEKIALNEAGSANKESWLEKTSRLSVIEDVGPDPLPSRCLPEC